MLIEATSMFQARMTVVVRPLAPGVAFGEVLKLTRQNDGGDTSGRDW